MKNFLSLLSDLSRFSVFRTPTLIEDLEHLAQQNPEVAEFLENNYELLTELQKTEQTTSPPMSPTSSTPDSGDNDNAPNFLVGSPTHCIHNCK